MDKKRANKPTDQNCFHCFNKYTKSSHGYPSVYFFSLFYLPLKIDPFEETPRKAEGYACQDVVPKLSKFYSIFKETYSLSLTFN